MEHHYVIKAPIVSEKSMSLQVLSRYAFIVDRRATKFDIKRAVEALFKVTVEQVNTVIVRGKVKRVGRSIGKRPNYKKAFVTLKAGDAIKIFEGV